LRTQHVGKRGLCNGQKRNEKRRKKHNFICACECRQWQRQVWGLGERGNGGMVVCVPPDRVVVAPLAYAVEVVPMQW